MYLAGFIVAGFLRGRRLRCGLAARTARPPPPRRRSWWRSASPRSRRPAQLLVGDWAARTVAERQPVKLAAFEGLQKTTKGAAVSSW